MFSYDWANGGSVDIFFRHGMVSGLWGKLVLFQGMGIKLKDKIVLQGCKERYCEYGPCYRSLCWIYILDESYLTRLSGLMDSKAGSRAGDLRSFPRRGDLSILIL